VWWWMTDGRKEKEQGWADEASLLNAFGTQAISCESE